MKKIIIHIEGMECCGCEKTVNGRIEKNFDIKKVTSSHEENKTVILAKEALDETKLKEVIEAAGFTVHNITTTEKKGLFGR
ncbi:MAG: heavy-metal-associated domain-containing protein [Firmicutes bacterium]|nr:heavy-metal-associated domain-containing protein [Bacillota bacterium]